MLKYLFIFLISFTFTKNINSCVDGGGFLPENDMYIPEYSTSFEVRTGVSQAEFNEVIDRLEDVYKPIIRNYGGNLVVNRLWSDGTVNASAQREGNNYVVNMYGGLARHQAITKDGFALVACHEIGHHIGGVPRYTQAGGTWASVEGQSDYFATTKCLRKLFRKDDNENIVRQMNIPALVKEKCEQEHSAGNEQAMCKRISMAGLSSASLFSNMQQRPDPQFNTPDSTVVQSTFEGHPPYQCRLDTYFNGAVCNEDEDTEIGQNDPNKGVCNRKEGDTEGLRPLCWYKPTHGGGGGTNPPPVGDAAQTPTVNGQTSLTVNNPNKTIRIGIDVRGFSNVYGFAIEVSKPNQQFTNPNGTAPDPQNGLGFEIHRGTHGTYKLRPSKQLPGWGTYQIRVIGLDRNRRPVSKYSNSFQLNLQRGFMNRIGGVLYR